jgi:hypothetical protein
MSRVVVVFPFVPVTAMTGDRGHAPRLVEHVDDRARRRCAASLGRVRVHADPGRRVDLDDHRAVLAERHRDVGAQHVDAGDVEPHRARRHLARGHVVGVHLVGAVGRRAAGREVRRRAQRHVLARRRHRVERAAGLREVLLGGAVARQVREHLRVPHAAPRVGVGLGDELAHRAPAVAHDVRRHPLGARHHAPVDHEHAVVASHGELLDDDAPAELARRGPGRAHLVLGVEPRRDAAAVRRVERLEDDREADLLRPLHGLVFRARHVAPGHGEPDVLQHALGVVLVLRDLHGDGARVVGHGRLDAAQVLAQAELHERARVEAAHRDAAAPRLLHDRARGRPEPHALVEVLQRLADLGHVGHLAHEAAADDAHRVAQRLQADLLLVVRDDHPPHALVARRHHAAEAHVAPRDRLQLERDVLQDVRQVRAVPQPLDEAAGRAARARMLVERGQRLDEPVREPGHLAGAQVSRAPSRTSQAITGARRQ